MAANFSCNNPDSRHKMSDSNNSPVAHLLNQNVDHRDQQADHCSYVWKRLSEGECDPEKTVGVRKLQKSDSEIKYLKVSASLPNGQAPSNVEFLPDKDSDPLHITNFNLGSNPSSDNSNEEAEQNENASKHPHNPWSTEYSLFDDANNPIESSLRLIWEKGNLLEGTQEHRAVCGRDGASVSLRENYDQHPTSLSKKLQVDIPQIPVLSRVTTNVLSSGKAETDVNRKINSSTSANQNGDQELPIVWIGKIPKHVTSIWSDGMEYSRKVFVGGLPHNQPLENLLGENFKEVSIEPPKSNPPYGHAYIIFKSEIEVNEFLQSCHRHIISVSENLFEVNYYFAFPYRQNKVQIIPWIASDRIYCPQCPTEEQDREMKVFVGGLHGLITAFGLYRIMNGLFHNVIEVCIDTDKLKYPIGSARVTFDQKQSYEYAVKANFLVVKTAEFSKKLQIDPYLVDSLCSVCKKRVANSYCRNLQCSQYFCEVCWKVHVDSIERVHGKVTKKSPAGAKTHKTAPEILAKKVG